MKTRLSLLVACLVLAGCGSGSSSPTVPSIQAAHTYRLADFQPAGKVQPGKPVTVSFEIEQPNGKPLTDYKRGGAAHGRAPDHRARRPEHDHPPASADRCERESDRADHLP